MAGLGFKDFQVGQVLTSSDVDGYLMQQTVMRFADSAARGSALGTAPGTAVALAEGMVSYLDDSSSMQVYNGSAWTGVVPGIGTNVAQTVLASAFTTSSATLTPLTGLSVSITPSLSSSKVLLLWSVQATSSTDTTGVRLQIYRGATAISLGSGGTTNVSHYIRSTEAAANIWPLGGAYLDSPATTSSVTYSVEIAAEAGGIATVNTRGGDTNFGVPSHITAIEVAA